MNTTYLESSKKQLEYYKMLGEKTIAQLPDDKLFWQYNDQSNSIAIIVKHISGNMLSRWTDFLTSDGEKDWRQRDTEFENDIKTKAELLQHWNEGWNCFLKALNSLQENDLSKTIYIRNEGHTVIEAINRQLAHYPYHIGQMVFIGKMICNEKWTSLSIPKGSSNTYNAEKFSKEKHKEHFTEEFLKNQSNWNKHEIITNLNSAHSAFWETAIGKPNPNVSINGKWSVAQNVEHINIALSRLNNYLSLPKSSIESNFGLSNRGSVSNKEFVKIYLNATANGIKTTAPYDPESNLESNSKELVNQGKNLLEAFISNLQNWSEEELERYNCPHPVLGKITVREILYFTIFHVQHHNETIKKMK